MFTLDEIRAGFEANEFFLEYLPTISLDDYRCVGAEALVRWRQPDRVVPPLEFILQMENTPMSGVLTYWVVERMADELGDWMRTHDDIHISINVPPEILGRGGLHYAMQKSNLRGLISKIMIEVTERGVPDQLGIAAFADAQREGLLVALDDLDMNEANLVVLSRIHTDVVKFDKVFADRLLLPDGAQQVGGLAALISAGGFKVIVEGIEKAVQAVILRDAGIQMAQGFYFSLPLSAAEFIDYFAAHKEGPAI